MLNTITLLLFLSLKRSTFINICTHFSKIATVRIFREIHSKIQQTSVKRSCMQISYLKLLIDCIFSLQRGLFKDV